jgi:hypothetical protein
MRVPMPLREVGEEAWQEKITAKKVLSCLKASLESGR